MNSIYENEKPLKEYNNVTLSQTYSEEHLEHMDCYIPVLALGIRGFNGVTSWQDICGPRNVRVAQFTDNNSLSANHGDYLFQSRLHIFMIDIFLVNLHSLSSLK